jgi:hypothetical protein
MSKVMIPNARLSFPNLFKKAVFNGKEGKFEATLLFPKTDTKTYKSLMKAIEDCKTENKLKVKDDLLCIKDGDEIAEDKGYPDYAGMWAVKAGNNKRPTLINRDKTQISEDDNVLYAGCYVNAIVQPWAMNNEFGKRISANLLGVQFVKDGQPFGNEVVASADEFDDIENDLDDL